MSVYAPPHREGRRRTFLRVLASGGSITAACQASRIGWATLYKWRARDAAFRAAWDEAQAIGDEPRIACLDDEMMRCAVNGVDEPVIRNGEAVTTRKRYSDPLLMFAIRELRGRRLRRGGCAHAARRHRRPADHRLRPRCRAGRPTDAPDGRRAVGAADVWVRASQPERFGRPGSAAGDSPFPLDGGRQAAMPWA
jgi:hypothetical protein